MFIYALICNGGVVRWMDIPSESAFCPPSPLPLPPMQDLFFVFPWNNFLHMQVEQCVQAVLPVTPAPPPRGGLNTDQHQLDQEGDDIAKSAQLQASSEAAQSDLKALRMHVSWTVGSYAHVCTFA